MCSPITSGLSDIPLFLRINGGDTGNNPEVKGGSAQGHHLQGTSSLGYPLLTSTSTYFVVAAYEPSVTTSGFLGHRSVFLFAKTQFTTLTPLPTQ